MGTLLGWLVLVGGATVALVGLSQMDAPAGDDLGDAGDYLRSLDLDDEVPDEFQRLLAQPFLSRVVHPIAGAVLSLLGSVLPGNYRERVHLQLVYAGLAGQYRAEEIITLRVLGAIVGFLAGVMLVATGTVGGG
jgi:hypothetical protein